MQESKIVYCGMTLRYYTHGKNPKWLIHSGTHGNEWGVIAPVTEYLRAHAQDMPNFIFVPEMSPSAVRLRRRRNASGNDVNRMFADESPDTEVRANLMLMYTGTFDLLLTFHEDHERSNKWYLYDTDDASESKEIQNLFADAAKIGVNPHSGSDWKGVGSVVIRNGYFSEQWRGGGFTRKRLAGQATVYAVRKGIAKRGITLEIPQRAPREVKEKLVAIIFQHFANA
ncbi:MAG: hypothetical protein Q7R85_02140 [bacterium]|nr:hypothetical protein [bacterium]